jgi:hypothetical protein
VTYIVPFSATNPYMNRAFTPSHTYSSPYHSGLPQQTMYPGMSPWDRRRNRHTISHKNPEYWPLTHSLGRGWRSVFTVLSLGAYRHHGDISLILGPLAYFTRKKY